MQFKHPELLYALFLLVIPILIHLFQLRKFKKVAFTNVAFLKKINIQTRKSNTIKKWLVLLSRMGIFAMLILAFAQPFSTATDSATKTKETVIYIDNSFSMQAKGASGQLLRQALQDVIVHLPEDQTFTLLTNTEVYKDITVDNSRNELLAIGYSTEQLSTEAISLKAKKEFSQAPDTEKRLILLSDFQEQGNTPFSTITGVKSYLVPLRPVVANNVVLDSIYITDRKADVITLEAQVSTQQSQETNIPVSLYNGAQLVAKATVSLDDQLERTTTFSIDANTVFKGKVTIDDPLLKFDNELFFSINTTKPIKVLSINEASGNFLERVFTQPEFLIDAVPFNDLDYSTLSQYDLIVLNEVKEPSLALASALKDIHNDGRSLLIIPNTASTLPQYMPFLERLGTITVQDITTTARLLTTINYDHPLLANVFEDRIQNFQYPSVTTAFDGLSGEPILQLEDGNTFLSKQERIYVFAGALNVQNTNFTNAPLIVPTLYNIGAQSKVIPDISYTIGKENTYDIAIQLQEDAVLQFNPKENPAQVQIPLQQSYGNRVAITTTDIPDKQGIYDIRYKDSLLTQVSYNYDRKESTLRYQQLQGGNDIIVQNTIEQLFDDLSQADTVNSLWKWFIIFALLFLVAELLILKFLK